MLKLFQALLFSLVIVNALAYDEEQLKEQIKDGIYRLTYDIKNEIALNDVLGYFPQEIEELAPQVRRFFMGKQDGYTTTKRAKGVACIGCTVGIDVIKEILKIGIISDDILIKVATKICSLALDESVCSGAVSNYLPELRYMANQDALDGPHFCALALGGKCGRWEDILEWEVDFPDTVPKPPYVPPVAPAENSPTTRVLHISDVHLDLSYKMGTNTDCGMPMCCMNFTEMANDTSKAAGYWGAYYCDTPVWTFEDMLKHIQEQHSSEIDYIMFTGDYPAHDTWLQSRENNKQHGKVATDLMKKYFPDSTILPNIGNHEAWPCNSMAIPSVVEPEFSAAWIYEYLGDQFSDWLPDEAKVTFSDTGFYTYELMPGFRIISINSILNLGYNFWTNLNYRDPGDSLMWLWDTLLKAEENNEKVHIIGHSPPNTNEFISGWAKNYAKIIDRFANTITGQFYGHTHNDEFLTFYDVESNQVPINVAFVTPSVTTFTGLNPSFRFYTLDGPYEGASMRVIDVDTYIFNMTAANEKGDSSRPEYFKLYNHREGLGMENLFPKDFDGLAHQMAQDDVLYQQFFRFFNSDSWGDDLEKREVVCKMVSSVYVDERKCNEIMPE